MLEHQKLEINIKNISCYVELKFKGAIGEVKIWEVNQLESFKNRETVTSQI